MKAIKLKKILNSTDSSQTVKDLLESLDENLVIMDDSNENIWGKDADIASLNSYPVRVDGYTIGTVHSNKKGEEIARLLEWMANKESERKTLAQETLDRYKEISLIYEMAEKIYSDLELKDITKTISELTLKQIRGNSVSLMLLNPENEELEILAASGEKADPKVKLKPGLGIAGHVFQSGIAEIVNDVKEDQRYVEVPNNIHSLICVPLRTQEGTIGVMNVSSTEPLNYVAADLKLLSAISAQAASAIEIARLHESKLKEEKIKSNLERYVSSQLVDAIINAKGNDLFDPKRKEITVLFSDIRSFTSKCEELSADLIVNYLNEYFTHMVDIIFQNKGTVNKFVGDMIVALFGAPAEIEEQEKKAIQSAIGMQLQLQEIPTKWIRENFITGIGINSGDVVVGNIGSPRHLDYTAIGDEVNVASRLQSIAKGGQILVSRNVYEKTKNDFSFKDYGSVSVKGKKNQVEVFEVDY